MGVVVVTSCQSESDLIEKASAATSVEVVDTGDSFWPKAVRANVEVQCEGESFKPQASIEGNMLHFWGWNLRESAYEAIMGALRDQGVYEVDSF